MLSACTASCSAPALAPRVPAVAASPACVAPRLPRSLRRQARLGTQAHPRHAAPPSALPCEYVQLATGLEAPVQVLYLSVLLSFLGAGSFLVVRQLLLRRELESAAKELGERVRAGTASHEELFEYGCVLLRKKIFGQAAKSLEAALAAWPAEGGAGVGEGLAAVHNALGFALAGQEKPAEALAQFRTAVRLQPGYVIAWNNLGEALEKQKEFAGALEAYSQALVFEPTNSVARERAGFLRERRLGM